MTNRHRTITIVAVLALGLSATALRLAGKAPESTEESIVRSTPGSTSQPVVGARVVDSLAAVLVRKAPFRWSRREGPASVSASYQAATPELTALPKPVLLLAGIVWGAHPLAVLEGVPGASEPRVVAQGDSAGGLRVRSVTRTQVVVSGFDTVWTLQLKVGWP
jgi:hypothetical protein